MGIATAAVLAMGAISAYGQFQEGQQRADAEEYNADIARQQAGLVQSKAKLDVYRQRKEMATFRGRQEALYSKAGVVLSGSALKVMQESAANAEFGIIMTELNAQRESSRYMSEADRGMSKAKAERTAGYVRAGTTLLSTAASV